MIFLSPKKEEFELKLWIPMIEVSHSFSYSLKGDPKDLHSSS